MKDKYSEYATGITRQDARVEVQAKWKHVFGVPTLVKYYHTGSRRQPFACALFNYEDEHDTYNHLFGWNQIEEQE